MHRIESAFIYPVAFAGEDLVAWPENYASHFVRYHSIDKPEGDNPAKIRFYYVNPEALAHAKTGEPLADDTILIMEQRNIVLTSDGQPLSDKQGGLLPVTKLSL